MSPKSSNKSLMRNLPVLVTILAAALSVSAFGQSQEFPTYTPGENLNGSQGPNYPSTLPNPWVVSDGTIITPAGTQVYLGIETRAKAVAVNPNTSTHTAAVLQMGTYTQAVSIFCTSAAGCTNALGTFAQGQVIQNYAPAGGYDADGSTTGISYTPDGKYLLFSQDGNTYYGTLTQGGFVAIASVDPTGLLSDYAQVSVPMDVLDSVYPFSFPVPPQFGYLSNVTCFPNSPGGTSGSFDIPCGYSVSTFSDAVLTSYPMGIAISSNAQTAYVVLDNNDTLATINLAATPPVETSEVRVGNVPHSVLISPNGTTAYVSNEAGRVAKASDFQEYSNGTPVVAAYPTGSTSTGTISAVNLSTNAVTTINVGLHPTGMAFWTNFGQTYLLVANTYDDTISVINTATNRVSSTINLDLVEGVDSPLGLGPNSIAVNAQTGTAYVALYNANAIAVVNLNFGLVEGLIPVGYAPASVVLDAADNALLVANDKGIGTTGFQATPPENSLGYEHGVSGLNTHQDLGTVSIVPVPNFSTLLAMTVQVFQNNHWDLLENILAAGGGDKHAKPVAIPEHIGSPSLIKHVFVVIRENRTYDQMLGDVAAGNGDASLAVFGDNPTYGVVTPNVHTLIQRFPLLDNFYDPSRQSADGHNWITQAMAPYSDDIQSPDWLRDYPSNGGDAIAYQKVGHLWDQAVKAGVSFKNYGEYVEYNTFDCAETYFTQANGYNGPGYAAPLPFLVSDSCEPSWTQFYNDTLLYESGQEPQLQYYNMIGSVTPLPNLMSHTVQNFPQFDLGIPDQYRVDVWKQDFLNDVANGNVPQLEFIWVMSDHTTGPPTSAAEEADNDLAVGRIIDYISHSNVWSSSAIFIEEDDAQNGVDHVDGHRSPGYIVSPYVKQQVNTDGTGAGITVDSTFYTQVNMTRTVEQILGLAPMNQFDLVASPMLTLFTNNPPANNFLPWTHVPTAIPLCSGVSGYLDPNGNSCPTAENAEVQESPAVKALRAGWLQKKAEISAGKYHTPDAEDPDTHSHYDWYDATGYKVPFPGEKTVRPASEFNRPAPNKVDNDD